MENSSYRLYDRKVIIRIRNRVCENPEELLTSSLFGEVLRNCINDLKQQRSRLLKVFLNEKKITEEDLKNLTQTLVFLIKIPAHLVPQVCEGADHFLADRVLMYDFVEYLYNYWRRLHRLIVCDSIGDRLDKRPYRTFNDTVEKLMHVVRSTYRDIQENISGNHPNVYRQVSAGAEVATIARPKNIDYPSGVYKKLNNISVTRQVLIYPPMIYNSPMNKRSGMFERVNYNPLENVDIKPADWLCYPAKVGPLLIMVYFSIEYFELGFSLSNLFELATSKDLDRKPDAVFLYGVPPQGEHSKGVNETVFYDDEENDLLVATIPLRDEYGYFGYLKKMMLTLHNIKMLKRGRLPYHGAMFNLTLRDHGTFNILVIGDSGAGKSETLEALRGIAGEDVEDLVIVADDMGSLSLGDDSQIIGYGTETGAFVRLDDLQSGYALGQIDRTIIMNPDQVNARVVLPVTKYDDVIKGYPVDYVLYANNYDPVDEQHPVIQAFDTPESALEVFRAGTVMSKGTTTTTGLVNSFYANIFGPPQYPDLQEALAQKYFHEFFSQGAFVGELRTQLGVPGKEHTGPQESAHALLDELRKGKHSA